MMAHDTGEVRKLLYPGIQFVGFISSLPEQFRNNTNRLTVVILSAILLFADMEYTGATPPEVEWNRTFGGAGIERAEFVKQTSDDGYILAGSTRVCRECPANVWLIKTDSYRAGDADVWLIKLEGNLIQAKEDSAKSEKQSPHTQDVPSFNAAFAIGSLLSAGHFILRKSLV